MTLKEIAKIDNYYLNIIRDQQKEIRLLNSKINDLKWYNSEIINSKNNLKNKLNNIDEFLNDLKNKISVI